jgi:hypothetical protein
LKRLFHIGSFTCLLWPRIHRGQAYRQDSRSGIAERAAGWFIADEACSPDQSPSDVPGTAYTYKAYAYKMYSFGGGIDIQATPSINLRAVDFEDLQWPGYQPSGLTPRVWSFGRAYAFR